MYKVYKHTCKTNQKSYIGCTCEEPKYRYGKNGVRYKRIESFWNDIQLYGWDEGFTHEIIYDNLTKEEALTKEKELIELYDTLNPDKGYNSRNGARGTKPQTTKGYGTSEYFEQQYTKKKGRETYIKYGKKWQEEHMDVVIERNRERRKTQEFKEWRKKYNEENKEHIREKQKIQMERLNNEYMEKYGVKYYKYLALKKKGKL